VKLTVVIVNYNVEHFLEQCLQSVRKAMMGIEGEVFVVDNNSVDGSVQMIREKFPEVQLIANKHNPGFSKANNQAISRAKGEYVLLLNPDTVVQEDTFSTCILFMDLHPESGACGVKLIDGKGKFLPESKRGIPTPAAAFYKIFGFSALFPRSRRFGRYHLGFLDPSKIHEIEVLSGAFMFMRKAALEKAGLLDEAFFMYGEDIDLSYRILQAGYKIHYNPSTRIIHYRGESTRKGSINYVLVFYQAMIIFARKHFNRRHASIFSFLIHLAVYLRAGLAISRRAVTLLWLPLADFFVFSGGMYLLKNYWAARSGIYYPYSFLWIAVPLYCLAWIGGTWLSGGYDRPLRISRSTRGILAGTVLILLVYALLDEQYRYSRFLIMVGTAWAALASSGLRLGANLLLRKQRVLAGNQQKRILIIGLKDEANRIAALLNQSPVKVSYMGIIHPDQEFQWQEGYAGNIYRLKDMVDIFSINELIFCGRDLSSTRIMDLMMEISHPDLEYKIAPPESLFIIGSNSIQSSGELYTVGLNSIGRSENRRKKRLLDISMALFLLPVSPVLLFFLGEKLALFPNLFRLLIGKLSLVGYVHENRLDKLPTIKPGILNPLDPFTGLVADEHTRHQANILYAKDYRVHQDIEILLSAWKKLGRRA
jgi:O-antigen biosynthesis protein